MNAQEIDETLDEKTILQLTFKADQCCAVAVAIVKHLLDAPNSTAWGDEVPLPEVGDDDKNCIGLAWRRLKNVGIIAQTGDHRRSKVKSRRGGVVWKYNIVSRRLAATFLHRNGHKHKPQQQELFAA